MRGDQWLVSRTSGAHGLIDGRCARTVGPVARSAARVPDQRGLWADQQLERQTGRVSAVSCTVREIYGKCCSTVHPMHKSVAASCDPTQWEVLRRCALHNLGTVAARVVIVPMEHNNAPVKQGIAPSEHVNAPVEQGFAPMVQGIESVMQGVVPMEPGSAIEELGNAPSM